MQNTNTNKNDLIHIIPYPVIPTPVYSINSKFYKKKIVLPPVELKKSKKNKLLTYSTLKEKGRNYYENDLLKSLVFNNN
jgi:hypothetical protein